MTSHAGACAAALPPASLSRSVRSRLAAGPGFWQAATQADFLRGDVDQLSIDEHGRLTLGPEADQGASMRAVPFVWTLVAGADGAWFLGTGNDGKVIKVDRRRPAARCSTTAPRWKCTRSAAAPNGGLYVGTSPDGRIYRVDAKGQATPFFDPDDKYIWSLVVDREGQCVRRHRRQGHRLQITPDGKGRSSSRRRPSHADVARVRSEPAAARRHRRARPRVPRRRRGQRLPARSTRPTRKFAPFASTAKGVIYAAAQSARASEGGSDCARGAGRAHSAGDAIDPERLHRDHCRSPSSTCRSRRRPAAPRARANAAAHDGGRRLSRPARRSVG